MLSPDAVFRTMDDIQPALEPTHPLMLWKAQFGAETPDEKPSGRGEEYRRLKRLFESAAIGRGDPYCDAILLGQYAAGRGHTWINNEDQKACMETFFEDLTAMVNLADEPVLEYWLADAALNRAGTLFGGRSGKLQMLACHLAERLRKPVPSLISLYIQEFMTLKSRTLAIDNQVAYAVLTLVGYFRELTKGAYEPLFVTLESRFLAVHALFEADQDNREGVEFYGDIVHDLINGFIRSRAAARLESDHRFRPNDGWSAEEELLGIKWTTHELGSGLNVLADAELLAGIPERALRTLRSSIEVAPYLGDENDLKLLQRVLRACYPERGIET